MTVIAYRNGVLASDSIMVANHLRVGTCVKIWATPNGLVSAAGGSALAERFVRWAQNGMEGPAPSLKQGDWDAEGIVFPGGDRCMWWASDQGMTPCEGPFFAFGIGRDLAWGAMAMGATAEQAVEVAIRGNVLCGGPIQVLRRGEA